MFGFKKKDKKAKEIVLEKTPQTKFVAVAYEGNGQVSYFEKALYYEFYTGEWQKASQEYAFDAG